MSNGAHKSGDLSPKWKPLEDARRSQGAARALRALVRRRRRAAGARPACGVHSAPARERGGTGGARRVRAPFCCLVSELLMRGQEGLTCCWRCTALYLRSPHWDSWAPVARRAARSCSSSTCTCCSSRASWLRATPPSASRCGHGDVRSPTRTAAHICCRNAIGHARVVAQAPLEPRRARLLAHTAVLRIVRARRDTPRDQVRAARGRRRRVPRARARVALLRRAHRHRADRDEEHAYGHQRDLPRPRHRCVCFDRRAVWPVLSLSLYLYLSCYQSASLTADETSQGSSRAGCR